MPDTQISEPLTQVERLRLAIALTESYDDRVFEIEPECVEALLKEYDELKDKYNKITAALSGHVVVPRTISDSQLNKALGREEDARITPMFSMFRDFYHNIVAAPPVQEMEG